MLISRVIQLTIPCSDNGTNFIRTDRLDQIKNTLSKSAYKCMMDLPLASIYCHQKFQIEKPTILISNHIDSLYNNYFVSVEGNEIHGTFDNSACNAVVVELMLNDRLPSQTLVSFTGDEENNSAGVDQTIDFLKKKKSIFRRLEIVIALDLTEEFYDLKNFSIENYFVKKHNKHSLLRFERKKNLKKYLSEILNEPAFIKNAEPDESWQYDEYDLNCFTLCLPCRVLGADMHDDIGVAIRKHSLAKYAETLAILTQKIDKDIAN